MFDSRHHISNNESGSPTRWSGFFVVSLIIFIFGICCYLFYIGNQVLSTVRTIFIDQTTTEQSLPQTFFDLVATPDTSQLRGFSDGRINILLLGIAGASTIKNGQFLTDTVMIASVDTINRRLALFSLPRDLLVETDHGLNKINAFYAIGKDLEPALAPRSTTAIDSASTDRIIISTDDSSDADINISPLAYSIDAVHTVTDLPVHYSIVMDFAGFEGIVDALDGINVDVPRTIDDPLYPGPNYSFDPFYIEQGFHLLDGSTALKYVRTRHDDPLSDFGRAQRQQDVLRAIRNKAFSLGTFASPRKIGDLLSALSTHTETTINARDMRRMVELFDNIDTQNITSVVIDAWQQESLLVSTQRKTPVGTISGLAPRTGSWDEIQEYADNIFSLDTITLRRDAVVAENPRILLIADPAHFLPTQRIQKVLESLRMNDVTIEYTQDALLSSSITDHTERHKSFTLDTLSKRFTSNIVDPPTETLLTDPSDANLTEYDFSITIGRDLVAQYSYEEADRTGVESDQKILLPRTP